MKLAKSVLTLFLLSFGLAHAQQQESCAQVAQEIQTNIENTPSLFADYANKSNLENPMGLSMSDIIEHISKNGISVSAQEEEGECVYSATSGNVTITNIREK